MCYQYNKAAKKHVNIRLRLIGMLNNVQTCSSVIKSVQTYRRFLLRVYQRRRSVNVVVSQLDIKIGANVKRWKTPNEAL